MRRITSLSVALAAATLCACVGEIDGLGVDEGLSVTPLEAEFGAAARAHDVPVSLLKAIGYVETRWEMVEGHDHHVEDTAGSNAAFGVMALRGERLERAAALAGVSVDDAAHDQAANILAAAALLSALADSPERAAFDRDDLAAWAEVVAEWSGIGDADARARYVITGVYGTLVSGAKIVAEDGTLIAQIEAIDVDPDYEFAGQLFAAGGDYLGATWRPSPNTSARPSGLSGTPSMIIMHTCEGNYLGCYGWLRNRSSGVSAHYVVKEDGSEITQLVSESRKAWHIGARYDCSRNAGVDCWRNGSSSNNFTIGIEHAGFASQSSFSSGQIESSAALVCDVARRHNIPIDAEHIVGHGQLQPYNRSDPGRNWPWVHYLQRVRAYCGDTSGGDTGGGDTGGGDTGGDTEPTVAPIIIDSNNSRNDSRVARIEVSSSWRASNSVTGYYNTGYWYARTDAVSDAASFWFYADADGERTVDAWWPAASDRSSGAPFIAFDASGRKLGASYQDQRINGRRWVTLGTWRFTRGWNQVVLSRWASSGAVVVADALRVR